jgi:hypothetical protein
VAINFPASPTLNQIFKDSYSGNSYRWTGYQWTGFSTSKATVTEADSALYANVAGIATYAENLINTPSVLVRDIFAVGVTTFIDTVIASKKPNIIPFYYLDQNNFPSALGVEGSIAYSETDNQLFFSDSGQWKALLQEDAISWVSYPEEFKNTSVFSVSIGTTESVSELTVQGDAYISGNSRVIGILTATAFIGDGSGLTNLNIPGSLIQGPLGVHTFSNLGINTLASEVSLQIEGDGFVSGALTATRFVGDGSGLTNLIAVSNGIDVYNNDVLVGTAATINFGENLNVEFGLGIATVTGSAGGGVSSQWEDNILGIHTLSNVGIGTTLPFARLSVDGTVSATFFQGDGSLLTNLPLGSQWETNDVGINTTSSVGIGTTNQKTTLQIKEYGVEVISGNTSVVELLGVEVDSFDIGMYNFKTAEYTVYLKFGATYIQAQKILLMQDQANVYTQEYAIMYEPERIASFTSIIDSGSCKLLLVPEAGFTGQVEYRLVRNTLL